MFKLKRMKKLPQNYPLYESSYGDNIPVEQYYIVHYDLIPSKYVMEGVYNSNVIILLYQNKFDQVSEMTDRDTLGRLKSVRLFVNETLKMMVLLKSDYKNKSFIDVKYSVEIIYDIKKGNLNTQINVDDFETYRFIKEKSNISLIRSDAGFLDTQEYDLKIPNIDLELNYGSYFLNIHNVMCDRLNNDNDKGIILLHGDPGTGKTTYIKYLTSLIKKKEVLFVPPSMIEILSDPSIVPFLMDHKNSILIIEDAERVISDREISGSPTGVSNILNITDGILGDCLGIQIIATFNMSREKIDNALLRKGRLIAEHKFEKLNVIETNKLLKHLNKDVIVNEGMTLADIYNIDEQVYKTKTNNSKIGFNR